MADPFPLAPSLWAATAPPAPPTPLLSADRTVEVAVIGGGYLGLSAALRLAERGREVALLEAREPGWGGSGRNGGQVIAGVKYDPRELAAKVGEQAAQALAAFVGSTADLVFDLIERHEMDVPHARAAWIQGAHSPAALDTVKARADDWAKRGVAARFLDKAEVEARLGTAQYLGGWLDPRGGAVQPLAYARGLARAAIRAGATIHGDSPVVSLKQDDGFWVATTEGGARLRAKRVILGTGGYTGDLIPKLRQTVITPNSYIVATKPLSPNLRATIMPGGIVSSDTRQLLLYFRQDHEGRLLMGGRGPFREPKEASDWAHLERVLGKMFPQIGAPEIDYRWCGRVALTRDFLPHLHEPEPGLLIDIGCMGRGVGLQTAMGRAMADHVASEGRDPLPFAVSKIRPLPLHALNQAYVSAIIAWYRLTDGGVR
jgi:glycine/D-amino acid oxidase-like deaminating enzyme